MTELPAFPDAENVVMGLLEPLVTDPDTQLVTVIPEQPTLPTIQVLRTGGSDDYVTDFPNVEVKVLGSSRPSAWDLAEKVRQVVLGARCTQVGSALIDGTVTVTPAVQVPDEGDDVRAVVASYQLAMRRLKP